MEAAVASSSSEAWSCSSWWYLLDGSFEKQGYPPTPFLWMTCMVDNVCTTVLPCRNWRESFDGPWFAEDFRVPSVLEEGVYLPKLSYPQFVEEQQQTSTSSSPFSLPLLYRYAFETPDTNLSLLTTREAVCVTLLLVLLIRTLKAVLLPLFCRLGRATALARHGEVWVQNNPERLVKFGEYCYRLCFHTAMALYGVVYFWNAPWFTAEGNLTAYQGLPYHSIPPGFAWYYLIQAAYNVDAVYSLLILSFECKTSPHFRIQWSSTVRGDFTEMAIHHAATNGLVFFSSLYGLQRPGSIVMLLHDISDVPIDISKLAHFLRYRITTALCFTAMVLMWMVTRLYLYPQRVIFATFRHCHVVFATYPPLIFLSQRHIVYVLLIVLALLHVVWFLLFLQMFYGFFIRSEMSDLSEHKQGEAQHHQPHPESQTTTTGTAEQQHQNGGGANGANGTTHKKTQ